MKIVIWGQELTAWVTAAVLAQTGNDVRLVSESKVKNPLALMDGSIQREPYLKDIIEEVFAKKRLQFVSEQAALACHNHILSLNAHDFDLAQSIVRKIGNTSQDELLIINQSHFGVGSTDRLQSLLNTNQEQTVAYFAENISEGEAIERIRKPKSITLGCSSEKSTIIIRSLLRPFCDEIEHFFVMTPKEAEFSKLATMGMLALRIGYINELANLSEQLDVNIDVIRQSLGADPRIGRHYLSPGCGFGGNNFPQTIKSLAGLLAEKNFKSELLDTIIEENENQKEIPFRKLWQHFQCHIRDLNIAIWGASFKPGSASLDGAPSLMNIDAIIAQKGKVRIHDPEALDNVNKRYAQNQLIETFSDKYKALENADALLLLTEWPEYRSPDFWEMKKVMKNPVVIDGRNVFNRDLLERQGFTYYGIGL